MTGFPQTEKVPALSQTSSQIPRLAFLRTVSSSGRYRIPFQGNPPPPDREETGSGSGLVSVSFREFLPAAPSARHPAQTADRYCPRCSPNTARSQRPATSPVSPCCSRQLIDRFRAESIHIGNSRLPCQVARLPGHPATRHRLLPTSTDFSTEWTATCTAKRSWPPDSAAG